MSVRGVYIVILSHLICQFVVLSPATFQYVDTFYADIYQLRVKLYLATVESLRKPEPKHQLFLHSKQIFYKLNLNKQILILSPLNQISSKYGCFIKI